MTIAFSRNFLLLLLLSLGFVGLSHAQQSPQAVFDRANEQLEEGNYSKALESYKILESRNTVSGALFLNMGIVYHRLDSLGKAKYYLLKASRFDETEKRARETLEFVESQFSRQPAVLPKLPWDVATDWLRINIGAANIMIGGIILLNIGMLIFAGHWFLNWYPNILRISGLTALIIALLLITTGFYTDYIGSRYSKAVMVSEKSAVVEKPQAEAPLIGQAYEGYTFTVDHYQSQSKPGWAYVRMSNGLYGWIPKNEILIL